MARVTVEDCILKIPNRFDLVAIASQRTREISAGSPLTVDRDNDKNPVISLREIADETVSLEALRESLIKGHQKIIEVEEDEEEMIDLMEGEREWVGVASEASAPEHKLEDETMHEEFADEDDDLDEDGEEDLAAEDAVLPEEDDIKE